MTSKTMYAAPVTRITKPISIARFQNVLPYILGVRRCWGLGTIPEAA